MSNPALPGVIMLLRRLAALAAVLSFSCFFSAAASAADCGGEAAYRSSPGGEASDIYFQNGSAEQRRVYWLDEQGQRKLKSVVEAGQTQRVSTVNGHYWVVTDAGEKCLYVIVAASAPLTAEIGTGKGTAPAAQTQTPPSSTAGSTVSRLGLSGWYHLGPVSKQGRVLNNMENGRPEIERVKDDWDSAYWQIIDVPGTGYVVIANKWTNKNLAAGGNGLHTVAGAAQGQGAHWSIETAGSGAQVLLKSRFNGRYLTAGAKGFEFVEKPGSDTALWQLAQAAQVRTAVEKPKQVEEKQKPEEKSRKCPSGERFDPDRLDCVSIKCGRHQVYSKSERQCLDKKDTCGKNEVYSSSVAACIPKEQPTPPPKPKVPPCAYKRDGAGNCLTPQFLACQKAFGACLKACGNKAGKCEAACTSKYAGTCGD